MLADTIRRSNTGRYFEDFLVYRSGDFTLTKGTGGAVAQQATAGGVAGGWLKVPTGALANDYQSISTAKVFEFLGLSVGQSNITAARNLPTVLAEARLLVSEAAANSSSWYFGLTDTLTTGFLDSTGAPPASWKGAVIYKPTGSNVIKFRASNGTANASLTNIGTFVSGVPLLLSIVFDPSDGVTGYCLPEINTDASLNGVPLQRQPITLSGLSPMALSAGIVAGTAAAETLQLDYMGCEFRRF